MSTLITAVFKTTIGLLVNKGRDKLAEKLNEGDVTDQKFRGLIVREMDEMQKKLDGVARKDLLAGISLFREGIELLYEVFESAKSSSEHRVITAAATVERFDIATEMRKMELKVLDESSTRKLSKAKRRFEEARLEAVKAFSNEALELPDRLLAMQYRLMATLLESVDNPTDALGACRVCLEELHRVPAVKESFKVELEVGLRLRARFNKDERRQIIFSVCHLNRVICNVMQTLRDGKMWTLPSVDTGKETVDPLRDGRLVNVLTKQGMEHCCLLWSFGHGGENKLKDPMGIATNTQGQFLVADYGDKTLKVFGPNGKFDFRFNPQTDDADTYLQVWDVAIAHVDENIYLLVKLKKRSLPWYEQLGEVRQEVQVFNKTADLQHKFPVRTAKSCMGGTRLTVSSSKMLLLTNNVVDVYNLSGEFVCSFGEGVFKCARDITVTCDGRVMVLDPMNPDCFCYLFTVEGQQLAKFNVNIEQVRYYAIACHPTSEYVVFAGLALDTCRLKLAIYTVNGEFVRPIQLDEKLVLRHDQVRGISVTKEGHIAVAFRDIYFKEKVIIA